MKTDNTTRLLRAIDAGRIYSHHDAAKLKLSPSTFWRLIRDLRCMGVVIDQPGSRNGRGAKSSAPWVVRSYGSLKGKRK